MAKLAPALRTRRAVQIGSFSYLAAYAAAFLGKVPTPIYQPKLGTWSFTKVKDTINMGWFGVVAFALAVSLVAAAAAWLAAGKGAPSQGIDRLSSWLAAATLLAYLALSTYVAYVMAQEWIWR